MIKFKGLGPAVQVGALIALAYPASASAPPDKFDPDLAQHPYIGKLYVRSFRSGVRIPAEFRGEWSSQKSTCGTDGDDLDTRIFVEAVIVGFGDETHVVTQAKRLDQRSVSLTYGPLIEGYHSMIAPPVLSVSRSGKVLEGWDAPKRHLQGRWTKCPRN